MKIKVEVPTGYKKIRSGGLKGSDLVYHAIDNIWVSPTENDLRISRDIKHYHCVCRKIKEK